MAAPPGPSRKSREAMFPGEVHKTGTPRGTCFFFFCASTTLSGSNKSKTKRLTRRAPDFYVHHLELSFQTAGSESNRSLRLNQGKVDRGKYRRDLTPASYNQVVPVANTRQFTIGLV